MLMNILELLDELKFIKVPDYIKKAEFEYEDLVKFNKEINEFLERNRFKVNSMYKDFVNTKK